MGEAKLCLEFFTDDLVSGEFPPIVGGDRVEACAVWCEWFVMASVTACAVLCSTLSIKAKPVLRSTRLTMACWRFLPMMVSASPSPIRLSDSTMAGRCSMNCRLGE